MTTMEVRMKHTTLSWVTRSSREDALLEALEIAHENEDLGPVLIVEHVVVYRSDK